MQTRDAANGRFGRLRSIGREVLTPWLFALIPFAGANAANWLSWTSWGMGVVTGLAVAAAGAALIVWGVAAKRKWTRSSLVNGLVSCACAFIWSALYVAVPLKDSWWILDEGGWWPLVLLGMVMVGLCGYGWWKAHRLPYTAEEPEEEVIVFDPIPEPEPEPEIGWTAQIQDSWNEFVKTTNGPLPGTSITAVEEKKHTAIFDLDFVRGRQSLSNAINNAALIASGLDVDHSNLIFEAHPIFRSASRARLTVITGQPLGRVVPYAGPQLDRKTGEIRVGPFADGEGLCGWRVFTANSGHGGHVCGAKGSGKSRVVDVIVHSHVADGRTVVWYGDPQRGASSAALSSNADWVMRDMDGIKRMLEGAVAVMEHREMENAADGLDGFTPSAERPFLLVVIDENAKVCRDKELKLLEMEIAERGRKTGVALLTISQQLDLGAFGGEESLRNNIIAGNLLMLRTTTRTTKDLIGGLDNGLDPSKLPAVPGYGYRLAPEGEDGRPIGRSAPFRAFHLGDEQDASKRWFDQIPLTARAVLDAGAVAALAEAGCGYVDRHVAAEKDLAAMRTIVERRRKGLLDESFGAESGVVNASPARPKLTSTFTVPAFGGGTIGFGQAAPAATAVLTRDPLTDLPDAARAVYDQVQSGGWRPADLAAATGFGNTHIENQLKLLITEGLVEKVQFGHYHALGYESACNKPGCAA